MTKKEIVKLAKKLEKEIKKDGWTIEVHTKVLALVHHAAKL